MFLINLVVMIIFIAQIYFCLSYTGFFYWFNIIFIAVVGTYFVTMSKEQFKEELMNAWIAGLSCNDKDSNCYVDKRIAKVKFSRFV